MNEQVPAPLLEAVSGEARRLIIGSVRRFGPDGILYEIKSVIDESSVLVRVIETGEEVIYPADAVHQDPAD